MTQAYFTIILIACAILICLVTLRSMLQRRNCEQLQKKLDLTLKQLEERQKMVNDLRTIERRYAEFKKDLQSAELSTNFQKPRLNAAFDSRNITAPERYKYVQSLSEKGLAAEDIASILSLSPIETEQILNLASLAEK